jgi:polar amino acid transport system substrate-binding protein
MTRRSFGVLSAAIALVAGYASEAGAATYKVAVMELPLTEVYKRLMTAIAEVTNNTIEIEVVPPSRALSLIESKKVDVLVPRVVSKDPAILKELKYDYATTAIRKSAFVLYINKNKPLDVASLRSGNSKKYVIETDGASTHQFGFVGIASNDPEASLKKVDLGRIDGYVTAQQTGDSTLKRAGLKGIRRQLWDEFDSGLALQSGQRGGSVDAMITEGLKKLKESNRLDQIIDTREGRFVDWQP